jgi:hypothetical protein
MVKFRNVAGDITRNADISQRFLETVERFNKEASRQATIMTRLTWAIAILTLVMTAMVGMQLWALLFTTD